LGVMILEVVAVGVMFVVLMRQLKREVEADL
jgi:hypothetical protein